MRRNPVDNRQFHLTAVICHFLPGLILVVGRSAVSGRDRVRPGDNGMRELSAPPEIGGQLKERS